MILDLVCVLILSLKQLPEHDKAALFALADAAAQRLCLMEGDVFSGSTEEQLVEQGVRFAGGVGNRACA